MATDAQLAGLGDNATPDTAQPLAAGPNERLASLDFIRGIAVMGILAANIVAFGQPLVAYSWPGGFLSEHGPAADMAWVAQFVLVDGKMRGLFTLLFGAGMILFLDKAWERGSGRGLQAKRLFWLGIFGLVHFFFIWRGDILFLYAVCGLATLLCVKWSPRAQLWTGLVVYTLGGLFYTFLFGAMYKGSQLAEGSGGLAKMGEGVMMMRDKGVADGAVETPLIVSGDYAGWVGHNLSQHTFDPLFFVFQVFLETIPLILIGMALYRFGLFDGRLDAGKQRMWGWIGLLGGGLATLAIGLWNYGEGLSFAGATWSFIGSSTLTRLPMVIGMAALLALWGPKATGWLGQRVSAAGRAAFTNYLGTSILMLVVFHGWGLGLFGELGRFGLYAVMVLAWIIMLAWSKPWLERFRYGPLEWLWRCLTYGKVFGLKR